MIGIVYVVIGNKELSFCKRSIHILKKIFPNLPIKVYTDLDIKLPVESTIKIKESSRNYNEGHILSRIYRTEALLESEWEVTGYLDNDVFVVDPCFIEGFEIAKQYGISMPINPWGFIWRELLGKDAKPDDSIELLDMPKHSTAFNTGLIFYHKKSEDFLKRIQSQYLKDMGRFQVSLLKVINSTKIVPYPLSNQWLVCEEFYNIDNPITLHIRQKLVYKRWLEEYCNKIFL